ncbi:GTPase domain-containing protein [Amycolatopsis thailandensis]|uniref:GTPase domain-containing protein n=1 Tax=Amycolatopsis thailandensis TaxID=589330 RepID=UPI00362CF1FE
MSGDSRSQSANEIMDRDLADIIDEVLESSDIAAALSALQWSPIIVDRLRGALLADADFRRRAAAHYEKVRDQATTLDEHDDRKPVPSEADYAELLTGSNLARLCGLATVIIAVAIFTPKLVLPDNGFMRLMAMTLLGVALYYLPLTQIALQRILPITLWRRLRWGRRRWLLHLGFAYYRWDWKAKVRDEIVLPEVTEKINHGAPPVFSHKLSIHTPEWARAFGTRSFLIPTASVANLARALSHTRFGAIALAGRRGVGKTTLLEALHDKELPLVDQRNNLTVMVSAPARYELREFILHLHTVVCRTVLDFTGHGLPVTGTRDRWQVHLRRAERNARWRSVAWHLNRAAAQLVLGAAFGALLWYHDLSTLGRSYIRDVARIATLDLPYGKPDTWSTLRPYLALGVITLVLFLAMLHILAIVRHPVVLYFKDATMRRRVRRRLLDSSPRRPGRPNPLPESVQRIARRAIRELQRRLALPPHAGESPEEPQGTIHRVQLDLTVRALASLAAEQLRQIRFLQTHTSGWSGKIDAPKGLGLTATRSIAHAEQPLTQPEVVDQLRTFLGHAVTTLKRAGHIRGITIAIDELDKFADPAQAHEFVNEIKTVFGVEHCVFLVSVSDDALASFERRGIPVRDALDSAFSSMIAIDPFTLDETRRWLDRRVIGMPTPFASLCYCLSAGIPRELERTANIIDDFYIENERSNLSSDGRGGMVFHFRHLRLAEVTERLVAEDVAAKLHAFSYAAQEHPPSSSASNLVLTLHTIGELTHPTTADLAARLDRLANGLRLRSEDHDGNTPELDKLRYEAAGYCYLSATIVWIFGDSLTEELLEYLCSGSRSLVDRIAEARRALAIEPLLTWAMTAEIRNDHSAWLTRHKPPH